MADTLTYVNQETVWEPAVDTDTLTCSDLNTDIRTGVQLDTDGFDWEDATVVVTTKAGAEKTVTIADGTGQSALIGVGFAMTQVVISGIGAGEYTVTVTQ